MGARRVPETLLTGVRRSTPGLTGSIKVERSLWGVVYLFPLAVEGEECVLKVVRVLGQGEARAWECLLLNSRVPPMRWSRVCRPILSMLDRKSCSRPSTWAFPGPRDMAFRCG
jgi:hypothetical protein